MNKNEVMELIKYLTQIYPNFFDSSKMMDTVKIWHEELYQYDKNDVYDRVKELLSKQEFQMRPPTLYYITSTLKKKNNKIDWNEMVYFCDLCNKAFNDLNEMMDHRTRECSIEYVIDKTKEFFNKDLTKAELWAMEESEFQLRYNKLLHYIYEHTTDSEERKRIGYIFNPPNQQEAKAFLNKTNNDLQDNIVYM